MKLPRYGSVVDCGSLRGVVVLSPFRAGSNFTPHSMLAQWSRFVTSASLPPLRNAYSLDVGVRLGANWMSSSAQAPLLY